MDIIIKPFINRAALDLYDNSGNILSLIIFFVAVLILVFVTLLLLKKKIFALYYTSLFVLLLIAIQTVFLYVRGSKLDEVRNNGYLLLSYVIDFHKKNNRYPYDLDQLYGFVQTRNKDDFEVLKKTNNSFSCSVNSPDGKEHFGLSVYDDMLGWGFFTYRTNPERFELIDD